MPTELKNERKIKREAADARYAAYLNEQKKKEAQLAGDAQVLVQLKDDFAALLARAESAEKERDKYRKALETIAKSGGIDRFGFDMPNLGAKAMQLCAKAALNGDV